MATSTISGLSGLRMDVTLLDEECIQYEWAIRFPNEPYENARRATARLAPILKEEFLKTTEGPGVNTPPNSQEHDINKCNDMLSGIRIISQTQSKVMVFYRIYVS